MAPGPEERCTMWKPDLNLKCPAGQNAQRCNRAMAHRRRLMRGRVTLAILGTLGVGMLLFGSIFISNQTTMLRSRIAVLDSQREVLEAGSGKLLTSWNAATNAHVVIRRAQAELGLIVPEDPDLVLVCRKDADQDQGSALWRRFLSRFGGGSEANAADDPMGLVMGDMVSLTPRSRQDTSLQEGIRP